MDGYPPADWRVGDVSEAGCASVGGVGLGCDCSLVGAYSSGLVGTDAEPRVW